MLIVASGAQVAADHERLQVERDVAAGGELRGAAMEPWYYSPSLYEFGIAVNAPIMPLQGQVCRWNNRLGVSIVALALVGMLWSLVGAKLDGRIFVRRPSLRLVVRILGVLLAVALSGTAVLRNNMGLHHGAPIFWISSIGFFGWSIVILTATIRGMVRDRRDPA